MRPKALRVLLAALVVTLACVVASADVEPALNSGDTVTFLVPQGTEITSGPQGDVVHFIGQPVGATQVTGCVADTDQHPIQTVVLVDPGSGTRAERLDVIVGSQTTPIPPGTQLEDLLMGNTCFSYVTGAVYDKYVGTVK